MNAERGYPLSPQHKNVIKQVEEKYPREIVDKISSKLTDIDRQLFQNLSIYQSEKFPGVILPYSTFTLNVGFEQDQRTQTEPRLIYETIINGFSIPPYGHPLTQEINYPRAFTHVQEAQKSNIPTQIVFLCVGQVSGEGGKTTKQFNRAMRKNGFDPEAKIITSLAENMMPDNTTSASFFGRSMGAVKTLEVASRFHNAHPDMNMRVEIENPPHPPATDDQPSALHIMGGYLLEGLFKKRVKKWAQEYYTDPEYTQQLKEAFEQRGIDTNDTFRQKLSKEGVVIFNVWNILKNKIHKQEDFPFPVKVKISGFDPLTLSSRRIYNTLFEKTDVRGNVETEYVKTTHSLYKYPIDAWVQTIQSDDFTDNSSV